MGEEEKKPEEKKPEETKEEKKEEKKAEEEKKPEAEKKPEEAEKKEKKEEEKEKKEEKETPPEEIVLKVYMHCEGCARKVKRSLKGFEGVEDVKMDYKSHKVIVKGKKADPLKVCERIQKKSGRKVELISPLPKPAEEPKKNEEKENVKPEEKKEPPVIVAMLKVHMHCEACAQEIRKRIQKMKGVQSADPDLKSGQVTVKGVFDPATLVAYIYKRTGKHAVIVKQEPEKKEEKGKEGKEEKKSDGGDKEEKSGDAEKKEKKDGEEAGKGDEETKIEVKKNEFYYIPIYATEYVYPPQIFSDENPNACSVM